MFVAPELGDVVGGLRGAVHRQLIATFKRKKEVRASINIWKI